MWSNSESTEQQSLAVVVAVGAVAVVFVVFAAAVVAVAVVAVVVVVYSWWGVRCSYPVVDKERRGSQWGWGTLGPWGGWRSRGRCAPSPRCRTTGPSSSWLVSFLWPGDSETRFSPANTNKKKNRIRIKKIALPKREVPCFPDTRPPTHKKEDYMIAFKVQRRNKDWIRSEQNKRKRVVTCRSDKPRLAASSAFLRMVMYLLKWNSFSNSSRWWSVYTTRYFSLVRVLPSNRKKRHKCKREND